MNETETDFLAIAEGIGDQLKAKRDELRKKQRALIENYYELKDVERQIYHLDCRLNKLEESGVIVSSDNFLFDSHFITFEP